MGGRGGDGVSKEYIHAKWDRKDKLYHRYSVNLRTQLTSFISRNVVLGFPSMKFGDCHFKDGCVTLER